MFNTGMRGCGGESRTIGPVKPVEDDEMFLAFDVPEAGHIRLIDLNYRLCVRKTALPGASAGICTANGSFRSVQFQSDPGGSWQFILILQFSQILYETADISSPASVFSHYQIKSPRKG